MVFFGPGLIFLGLKCFLFDLLIFCSGPLWRPAFDLFCGRQIRVGGCADLFYGWVGGGGGRVGLLVCALALAGLVVFSGPGPASGPGPGSGPGPCSGPGPGSCPALGLALGLAGVWPWLAPWARLWPALGPARALSGVERRVGLKSPAWRHNFGWPAGRRYNRHRGCPFGRAPTEAIVSWVIYLQSSDSSASFIFSGEMLIWSKLKK